ncbi:hypothetical protein [Bradyrhizobium sp. 17]|jgi:hypothetical protein|uniref:hypothetical protein n=1 Tax=Bradyrhizobium sp. 17 TaxID=2782649 RepID=UPI001FF9977A|nr:hypothetical protein [Bradyrhizobium sp. 17]MCK1521934.1 hypothetical protein [Bradyrhizobium sp. 17]
MAYFYGNQDRIDRRGKIVADIFCAVLLAIMSVAFFGVLGGIIAFLILEAAIVGVDFVVPDEHASSGAVVR